MNQLFYGSICVTDLIEKVKAKHSGFTKAQNGKIYANINVWLNQTPDKYGNIMSVKVNPSKERKDTEEGFYIGNLKQSDGPKPIGDNDLNGLDVDLDVVDPLPHQQVPPAATEVDDLPF
jgi:hypothetical protein